MDYLQRLIIFCFDYIIYIYKYIIIFFICINFFYFFFSDNKNIVEAIKFNNKGKIQRQNKIIKENFFIIDSNNLEQIKSHLYGFTISKKGILTDNYYKKIGYYEDPEPEGTYIMIKKEGIKIKLIQDFYGSIGIYIYKNEKINYFAVSNSFLLLEEYLVDKQYISFNKDYADNLIISGLCTPSIHETLIKEINRLPPNKYIIIDTKAGSINEYTIDYKENTIPLESKKGLKIIDKWIDKWGYIFRSLKKQTNNIYSDLSGGFDTRILLTILLCSGVNLNDIKISTIVDNLYTHKEDFIIANNISSKFGFKLNDHILDKKCTKWSTQDTLYCSLYSKLGIHKQFNFKDKFFKKPRFRLTGFGGENIRGFPGIPIQRYIEGISSQEINIINHEKFYDSSKRLCNRTLNLLKNQRAFEDDYEISSGIYKMGRTGNHFGKASLEGFMANIYFLNPIMDSEIMKIKFNISETPHELVAYILIRFAPDLINYQFDNKRILDVKSIKEAEKLKSRIPVYQMKFDYNGNFYIDKKRKSPVPPSNENINVEEYLKILFNSYSFIHDIKKIYDNKIYIWAKEYSKKSNFFPLRHELALFAIALTVELLTLNENYIKGH